METSRAAFISHLLFTSGLNATGGSRRDSCSLVLPSVWGLWTPWELLGTCSIPGSFWGPQYMCGGEKSLF